MTTRRRRRGWVRETASFLVGATIVLHEAFAKPALDRWGVLTIAFALMLPIPIAMRIDRARWLIRGKEDER